MKWTVLPSFFTAASAVLRLPERKLSPHEANRLDLSQASMQSLKELARELSVKDALEVMKGLELPKEVKAFLSGEVGEEAFGPDYDSAKPITKINEVFEKAQEELDMTFISCKDDLTDFQRKLDNRAMDKGNAGSMLEDAIAEKNLWSQEKATSEQIVDKLSAQLEEFTNQCTVSAEQSKQIIALMKHDYDVIKGVVDGNSCKPADPYHPSTTVIKNDITPAMRNAAAQKQKGTSFLQTWAYHNKDEARAAARELLKSYSEMNRAAHHGGFIDKPRYRLTEQQLKELDETKNVVLLRCFFPDGVSFLSFEEPEIARAMVQMSNPKFQRFQATLEALTQSQVERDGAAPSTTPLPGYKKYNSGGTPASQNKEARDLAKDIRNKQIAGENVDAQAECSFEGSTLCPAFFETLSGLLGSVDTELNEEIEFRDEQARICKDTTDRMNMDIDGWKNHVEYCDKHGSTLAGRVSELKDKIGTIEKEYKELLDAYEERRSYCQKTIKDRKSSMCGAIRVKTELMRMSSVPDEIWDCEVSPFQEGECSKPCEGGVKTWSRSVILEPTPKYGTKCPPVSLSSQCNTVACPVDCKVTSWGMWTHCSVECGIGIKYKVRNVEQYASHGGQACPALQESADCNAGDCDKDCVLTDWGDWSQCSSYCGGGSQYRLKFVKEEAVGDGLCPAVRSNERYETQVCNEKSCAPGTPVCNTDIDLVLVIDSSGSIGKDNWAKIVEGISKIVHQVNLAHVQIGTIVFSDKVETYSVLTNDKDLIKDLYPGNLEKHWMGSVTNTHTALAQATKLLTEGGRAQKGAKQAVVLFTDGMPCCMWNSQALTQEEAKDLIDSGRRLVTVPMGSSDALFIQTLSKLASADSTIAVPDFDKFVKEETIAKLVEKLCDDIAMLPIDYPANVVIKDDKMGTVEATHSSNMPTVKP
uniref:VWFA domain-containing protein n=1 Tax=Chromera velia CCMP2878 TaxID=1169474 RepID=A0A0G4HIB9_9ALVE|eukprot:Cvel_27846.t1-p1 / transcript=Cvel_27846.t1 / gene=Cvel_27846 / organism=Chromera_velia_CCMP2878 / gene_product=Brain-specific angiogenesis inhibitor 3, putative / transcript_product=Brain-specific angiogenesis inhibitor 3, putative / location=Cvel_scaffold3542:3218-9240(+) / protein_length=925 / sequence_SO=supercontig / SO=protein_coding / is_pseudo=false